MSLEELKKSLAKEGRAEAANIMGGAQKQAAEIIYNAREAAKKIVSDANAKAEAGAQSERNERIGTAQLKAKKITSEAKNQVIEQALHKIWAECRDAPKKKPEYEKLVKKLVAK